MSCKKRVLNKENKSHWPRVMQRVASVSCSLRFQFSLLGPMGWARCNKSTSQLKRTALSKWNNRHSPPARSPTAQPSCPPPPRCRRRRRSSADRSRRGKMACSAHMPVVSKSKLQPYSSSSTTSPSRSPLSYRSQLPFLCDTSRTASLCLHAPPPHKAASISTRVLALAKSEPLRIMISGAPASGKGTQCELITQKVRFLLSVLHRFEFHFLESDSSQFLYVHSNATASVELVLDNVVTLSLTDCSAIWFDEQDLD